LVFFIEGVHGWPGERDARFKLARVGWQLDVLPCASRRGLLTRSDGIPGRRPEIRVSRRVLDSLQGVRRDVAFREVGHRITVRLEQHEDMLAVGDPSSAKTYAHAST